MLFRFFDLPRELRDEIYAHIWTSMPGVLVPYSPRLRLKASYDVAPALPEHFSSLPHGIYAAKPLLHEALSAFYRKGVIHAEKTGLIIYRRAQWRTPIPTLELICKASNLRSLVLTPLMAQELHVDVRMISHGTYDRDGRYCLEGHVELGDSLALRYLTDNHARIGAPKSLKIYTTCTFSIVSPARHIVNLGAFYELGRIAKDVASVEIVVGTNGRKLLSASLVSSWCVEMKKFGQTVLPDLKATEEKVYKNDHVILWRFKFTKV